MSTITYKLIGYIILIINLPCWLWAEDIVHLEREFCAKTRPVGVPLISKRFSRAPVNQNFIGNVVTVNGVPYNRTILVRAPWSATYYLDGQASELYVEIGMDDEASNAEGKAATASGKAEIRVDRVLVYECEIKPGNILRKVKIDLRKKYVLELFCNYGNEFKSQNVAWINPSLKVSDASIFRKTQEKFYQDDQNRKLYSPAYPLPPDWRSIKAEKTTFHIFENAYRFVNKTQEIIILPEFGGRIIHYSQPHCPNVLHTQKCNYPEELWVFGESKDIAGGHFIRPEPRKYFIPSDPLLVHGKYSIEFGEEGNIVMRSAPSIYLGMQFEYHLKINPSSLDVTNSIINTDQVQQAIGVWNITRINSHKIVKIKFPPELNVPLLPNQISSHLQQYIFRNNIIITSNYFKNRNFNDELLLFSQEANIFAEMISGQLFSIKTGLSDKDIIDLCKSGLYPVHIYINSTFAELESHSPIIICKPNERISLHETWRIINCK